MWPSQKSWTLNHRKAKTFILKNSWMFSSNSMYSWLFSTNPLPQCLARCIILLSHQILCNLVQIWIHSRSFNRQLENSIHHIFFTLQGFLSLLFKHTKKDLESRYGMNLEISLIFCGPLEKTGQYFYQLTLKF